MSSSRPERRTTRSMSRDQTPMPAPVGPGRASSVAPNATDIPTVLPSVASRQSLAYGTTGKPNSPPDLESEIPTFAASTAIEATLHPSFGGRPLNELDLSTIPEEDSIQADNSGPSVNSSMNTKFNSEAVRITKHKATAGPKVKLVDRLHDYLWNSVLALCLVILLCYLYLATTYINRQWNASSIDFSTPSPTGLLDRIEILESTSASYRRLQDQMTDTKIRVDQLESRDLSVGLWQEHYVNHFSPNLGALVDPYLTSPTLELDSRPRSQRLWRWAMGAPSQKAPGPVKALMPFHDVGECWCTPPTKNSPGRSQLAVLLPHRIIPTHLIVEHVPQSTTLDPGATPATLQFWVQILDREVRERVLKTRKIYDAQGVQDDRGEYGNARALDETWIQVAKWSFGNSGNAPTIQSFEFDHFLKASNVRVDKVVVRAEGWPSSDHVCIYRLRLRGDHQHRISPTVDLKSEG